MIDRIVDMTTKTHHWDFVDEDGCLHCNCGIGVSPPSPGSQATVRSRKPHRFVTDLVYLTCDLCLLPQEAQCHTVDEPKVYCMVMDSGAAWHVRGLSMWRCPSDGCGLGH